MKKDKKRIYFLIAPIFQIIFSIISILNVSSAKEEAMKTIEMLPDTLKGRMIEAYSNNNIFILPSVLCIIFSIIILIIFFRNSLEKRKKLVLGLGIATLLLADNLIVGALALISIVISIGFKNNEERHEKKEIPKLDRIDTGFKSVLGGILCLVVYFSQLFIPVSASKSANYIISVVFYIIVLLVCLYVFRNNLKRDVKAFKENWQGYISYIIPKLGIMYASYLIVSLVCVFMINQGTSINQQAVEALPLWYSLPLSIIWAPIVEELLFRGCIRRFIKNNTLYIITSGLIFGLLHTFSEQSVFSMIVLMIPYGLLGGFFAYFYTKTNNITTNMLCHSFHNTVVMLLQILLF